MGNKSKKSLHPIRHTYPNITGPLHHEHRVPSSQRKSLLIFIAALCDMFSLNVSTTVLIKQKPAMPPVTCHGLEAPGVQDSCGGRASVGSSINSTPLVERVRTSRQPGRSDVARHSYEQQAAAAADRHIAPEAFEASVNQREEIHTGRAFTGQP
uniref:Uncharacterized protein n=1 Tax=Anopheles maculatus TaxID=74869 RepID=A0A182SE14_9DIPT